MKTYKVWIDVEEYDGETEEGISVSEQLMFASCAEFKTFEEAEQFAKRLNTTGEQLAQEQLAQLASYNQRVAKKGKTNAIK